MRSALVVPLVLVGLAACPSAPVEGEGEGGEGEVIVVGEGEGEGEVIVVGEGEGEVIVVGEGEGEVIVVGEGEGEGEVIDPVDPFDPGHIVEVNVEIDPAEFAALSLEARSFIAVLKPGCVDAPFPSPFSDHEGSVTLDGERFDRVNITKKGFIGSLSQTKPGLKFDLDDFDPAADWHGLDKVVMNNAQQDPSFIHTCMTYGILRGAGVPAPRCNFAHVVVNGEDKGLYVQVENVKKQFLRTWFGDDTGNLYEGTLSDFTPEWRGTFEKETHTRDASAPEVDAISAALEVSDDELLDAVGAVVDLDAFYSFWAAEVLVGHWDGYSGNQNNFYLYGDPTTGKARFIAWGADATMNPSIITPLVSVQAQGLLTRRLYDHPVSRAAFQARLQELLDTAWNEPALRAEVDRMESLITPLLTEAQREPAAQSINAVRAFINGRRAEIDAEVGAGPVEWTDPFRAPFCAAPAGALDVSFTTTFGSWPTDDTFATGDGTLAGSVAGVDLVANVDGAGAPLVGAAAGVDENVAGGGQSLILTPTVLVGGRVIMPLVVLRTAEVSAGAHAVDDVAVQVVLLEFVGDQTLNLGRAYDGVLTLDAAGTNAGDAITGTLHAELVQVGF